MAIESILQTGLQGVQKGVAGAEKAALDIVRSGTDSSVDSVGSNDVTESIVDLQLYERSIEASAQVVKTADEVLGSLLDTFA